MSKHTPGPWTLIHGGYIATKPTAAHSAKFPKNVRVNVGHVCAFAESTDGENEANARLIAAAPDLLAALEDLAQRLQVGCKTAAERGEAVLIVSRAIAKAVQS